VGSILRSERDIATSWVHKQLHVSPEVCTELVSLMLSIGIATSRFRLLRSEHYIATAVCMVFLQKKFFNFGPYIIWVTSPTFSFYAPQLVPQGTAEARISYGISVCLSVRLSVTTRYRFNARW